MRNPVTKMVLIPAAVVVSALAVGGQLDPARWPPLDPAARRAIDLQCRLVAAAQRHHCERDNAAALRAGQLDVERILRVHCARFENDWSLEAGQDRDACEAKPPSWLESWRSDETPHALNLD